MIDVEAYELQKSQLYEAMCAASKRGHRRVAEDIRHQINELQYMGMQSAAQFFVAVIDRAMEIIKSSRADRMKLEALELLLQEAKDA